MSMSSGSEDVKKVPFLALGGGERPHRTAAGDRKKGLREEERNQEPFMVSNRLIRKALQEEIKQVDLGKLRCEKRIPSR